MNRHEAQFLWISRAIHSLTIVAGVAMTAMTIEWTTDRQEPRFWGLIEIWPFVPYGVLLIGLFIWSRFDVSAMRRAAASVFFFSSTMLTWLVVGFYLLRVTEDPLNGLILLTAPAVQLLCFLAGLLGVFVGKPAGQAGA